MAFKPPGQCPVCGEWVPRGAAACDDCGACAKSGWKNEGSLDGVDLPDDSFDYDAFLEREFGASGPARKAGLPPVYFWAGVALLIAFVWAAVAGLFG